MWNVRVKRFYDSTQVQLFSRPVLTGVEKDVRFINRTYKARRGRKIKLVENPFTGRMEAMREFSLDAIHKSAARAKGVIYDIARSNNWEWFVTFTFNGEKVDRYDYDSCVKKLSQWLKDVHRRSCPDMVYLVVPERHKDGGYHFHGLFSHAEGLRFEDSGHRDGRGRAIYNIGAYRWGFTTATRVGNSEAAAKYLVKYVTKDLVSASYGRRRYWASRNCERPAVEEHLVGGLSLLEKIERFGGDSVKRISQATTIYNKITYLEL